MVVSFEEFVAARWVRLVRSAVLLGADLHTAEDLTQTALARCHQRWATVSAADDVDAYVHRVLINSMIDSRRRRWRGETPTDAMPDRATTDDLDRVLTSDAVQVALARLPLRQRQVVVLRFYADLTQEQTATVLGIETGTVKSRTARALAVLEADPSLQELMKGGHP